MARTIIFILAFVSFFGSANASPTKSAFWYWVEVYEAKSTQFYRGTSHMNEAQLMKALRGTRFIKIENLLCKNCAECGKSVTWSEFNPELKNHVYLNPQFIISIHPLNGDPRNVRRDNEECNH